jgi:hypothetical protein
MYVLMYSSPGLAQMPYGLSFVEIISDDAQLLGASPAPASHPISNSHTDLLKVYECSSRCAAKSVNPHPAFPAPTTPWLQGGGEGEFRLGSFTVRAEKQPSVSLASFFKVWMVIRSVVLSLPPHDVMNAPSIQAAPGPRPGPEPGSVSPAPEASRAQAVTEAAKKRRQDAKGLAPKVRRSAMATDARVEWKAESSLVFQAVGAVHTDAPAARPGKRPMEKNGMVSCGAVR